MTRKVALLGASTLLAVLGTARVDLVAQGPAKGEPGEPSARRPPDYLILPVETELQRRLVRHPDVKFLVALNGSSMRQGDGSDQAVLKALRRDLGRAAAKDDRVLFSIFLGRPSAGFDPKPAQEGLAAIAAELGLKAAKSEVEWRNDALTWQARLAAVEDGLPAERGVEEAGVGGPEVRAYPVRSRLSRYLTGSADCVIYLTKPLAVEADRARDEETWRSVRAGVSELKLARKSLINFRVQSPPAAVAAREHLIGEFDRLSESLGFKTYSVSH